jgi:hypothetical protein
MKRRALLATAVAAPALRAAAQPAPEPARKTALLCAGLDVEDDHQRDMEEWHSKEHLQERIALDGFLRGRRLYAADMRPRYFIMYEIGDLSDLLAPTYLERLNDPTAWTQRVTPRFKDNFLASCVQHAAYGSAAGAELLVLKIRATDAAHLLGAFDSVRMQALCAHPGIYRARLAIPDVAASTVKTEEFDVSKHAFDEDLLLLVEAGRPQDLMALEQAELGAEQIAASGGEITFRGIYSDQASLSKLDLAV